jgi:hypothetical protein
VKRKKLSHYCCAQSKSSVKNVDCCTRKIDDLSGERERERVGKQKHNEEQERATEKRTYGRHPVCKEERFHRTMSERIVVVVDDILEYSRIMFNHLFARQSNANHVRLSTYLEDYTLI